MQHYLSVLNITGVWFCTASNLLNINIFTFGKLFINFEELLLYESRVGHIVLYYGFLLLSARVILSTSIALVNCLILSFSNFTLISSIASL